MSTKITHTESIVEGNTTITKSTSYDVENAVKVDLEIADAVADQEIQIAIDVSKLQIFFMVSAVAMTVKTNSSGSPQETFTLQPNVPVRFRAGDTAIFAGDITALFVSNSSGGAGQLQVISGVDE